MLQLFGWRDTYAQLQEIDSLERALKSFPQEDINRVNILNALAYLYYPISPKKTQKYGNEALALSELLNYQQGLVESNLSIGIAYWVQGIYDASLEYLLESLRIIEKTGKNEKKGSVLNIIGLIYYEQNTFRTALTYFNQSVEASESVGDLRQKAITISNIGRLYRRSGAPQTSLDYLNRSLDMFQEIDDKVMIGNVMNTIGEALIDMGEFDKALNQLSSANVLGQHLGVNQLKTATLGNMGRAFVKQKNYEKAEECLLKALEIAIAIKARDRIQQIYQYFSELYEENGQMGLALDYHKKYVTVRDSVFNEVKNRQIEQLRMQYDIERKDKAYQKLKLQKNTRELEIKRQKVLFFGVLCVLVVAAVMVFFILRVNRKIIRKNKLLEIQQKEIIAQSRKIEKGNTEILRQNSQLEMVNQKLIKINDEKNNLIDIVAHDLKSPINQILGILGLMNAAQESSPEEMEKYIGMIHDSAGNSLDMINKILSVHAIERGAAMVIVNEKDIIEIIKNKLNGYQLVAKGKEIKIIFEQQVERSTLMVDRTYFQQILDNLMSNALKYSPFGKHVMVNLVTADNELRLSVKDEGPGLSKEDLEGLFVKFKTLSAHPTGGESSTGVGLSIVKKFTEEMNGRTWAESKLGNGTTFFVTFPLIKKES